MGRPVWITKAGDLGVIAERQFYNLRFDVRDPDNGALTFSIVGGSLPSGLSLKDDGFIEGIPTVRKVFLRGVPTDVAEDVVNTFSVRCRTTTGHVSDRTFTLTVSGQDMPIITTTTAALGVYFDGTYFEYQLEAIDLDDDILSWAISTGELPNGLTLNPETGLISGYINLYLDADYGLAGWVKTEWDVTPWDFRAQSVSKNFQFTVSVTDGKDYALQQYRIFIASKDGMTADSDLITADAAEPYTCDLDNRRNPVLITTGDDIDIILHDNYFAYKFDGIDFDGDFIDYELISGSVPGLSLDPSTGWFYGYIPTQSYLERSYSISVRVVKRDSPTVHKSETRVFTFTIVGNLGKFIQWQSSTLLGEIDNGDVSEFQIIATNGLGRTLYYRLANNLLSGTPDPVVYEFTGNGTTTQFVVDTSHNFIESATTVTVDGIAKERDIDWTWAYPDTPGDQQFYINFVTPPAFGAAIAVSIDVGFVDTETISTEYKTGRLPQGLTLLPSGLISGRVSFNQFSFDGGTTTFDVVPRRTSSVTTPTTFDTIYNFTVEAYDLEGDISTYKQFSIIVNNVNPVPYDNMYVTALLESADRTVWRNLINDASLISADNVYRADDPYFGISESIRMLVAYGVYPDTAENVQAAVLRNHYNKRVQLGQIKTARALDASGNVKYEVVYVEISDNMETSEGASTGKSISLGNVSIAGGYDPVIYPNSFFNMSDEIYQNLSQVNKTAIPDWMSSRQEDGRILGLTKGAVICYAKPGKSAAIAFNITKSNYKIANFDIILDRYIWDNNLSEYYDTEVDAFIGSSETTFDRYASGAIYPLVAQVNYAVNIPFSKINGKSVDYVSSIGLDGVTYGYETGQTIIFVKQEQYDTLTDEEAWTNYTKPFDSVGFDSGIFDESYVIQGYDGGVSTNERVAVYVMTIFNNIITLEKQLDVSDNDRIDVLRGGLLNGSIAFYMNPAINIVAGETVPTFAKLEDILEGVETTFDQNGTRFFARKDVYMIPDENDAYIKWPQTDVFK